MVSQMIYRAELYVEMQLSLSEILMTTAPLALIHCPGQWWRNGPESKARQRSVSLVVACGHFEKISLFSLNSAHTCGLHETL